MFLFAVLCATCAASGFAETDRALMQRLVDAGETVTIPPRAEPYRLDAPVCVPAARRIVGTGATVALDCAKAKTTDHLAAFVVTSDVARLDVSGLTFVSPAATHPNAHLLMVKPKPVPENGAASGKAKLAKLALRDVTVRGQPPRALVHGDRFSARRNGRTLHGVGSVGADMYNRLVNERDVTLERLSAPDAVRLPPKDRVHVYLLMGQSNMAGYGELPEKPYDLTNVVMLSREGFWIPAREPLHFDENGGVGPGAAFARAAADAAPGCVIALVPCAQGATGSGSWRKGRHFYDDTVIRARRALRTGTLKGVLWHQGEADSYGEDGAKNYGAFLKELVGSLRAEFGDPNLKFVAGGLGESYLDEHVAKSGNKHWFWRTTIDETRRTMAELPNCGFASAVGLTHRVNDSIHLSCEAQRELGRRYAEAMGVCPARGPGAFRSVGFVATNEYAETVGGWTADNWVFAPTALYGGNRHRVVPVRYPPAVAGTRVGDPPVMADVYRLSTNGEPAKVEMRAGDLSAPLFGWWSPRERQGVVILAEPFTSAGETGFTIEERPHDGVCRFVVTAPGCRSRRYRMCRFETPSGDPPLDPGRCVPFRVRRISFAAESIPAFLDVVLTCRKDATGPTVPPDIEPFGFLLDKLFTNADRVAWYETDKVGYILGYPPNTARPGAHLQVGWCGAPVYTVPFLEQATAERVRRAARTLDAIATMPGKSGFLHAINKDGVFYSDSFKPVDQPNRTMIRRQTATLMAGLDVLRILKDAGRPVDPKWERALRGVADALVALNRKYGQLGQFVDCETGELLVANSTNGALAPAALLAAADWFGEPSYAAAAEELAERYRTEHLAQGYSGGGPSEALQCPDSESAGELTVSFERLWEKTGSAKWLRAARDAAALAATWVNAWNYPLASDSQLGRFGTKTAGAVWASVQNRHGAPGPFHYGSGDVFFRLWRATNDERYFALMADTARGIGQYVHTPLHPLIPEGTDGGMSERVNTGDWEQRTAGGGLCPKDCNMVWVTTAMFQMLDVPGVYVLLDGAVPQVRTIDRVRAHFVNSRDKTVMLENPTRWPTVVTVLAETRAQRAKPLGVAPVRFWRRVSLAPGERKQLSLALD